MSKKPLTAKETAEKEAKEVSKETSSATGSKEATEADLVEEFKRRCNELADLLKDCEEVRLEALDAIRERAIEIRNAILSKDEEGENQDPDPDQKKNK